jgi:hexosaminidase
VFKEVNACGDIDPKKWPNYCYQPPCGQIDPTNNLAYLLVYSVFAEVQTIFPARYVHLGADLFTAACYDEKPSIKDWMQQNNITDYFGLYDYFLNLVRQHIGPDHHRIYWLIEEFKNLTFWDKDILQYWQSAQNFTTILENLTNPIILGQWDELYINCGLGSPVGSEGCNPFLTWYDFYHFSIPEGDAAQQVLGAVATIWTDLIDEYNLDSLVFPRATALGLRLWNNDQ